MCFAPQRRALFRHLNFQKWSDAGVFCTFWLQNVLRATTACNFSSLIWPAASAPAALASLLFEPPEPQIIGKTQCFATFLPFRASASSFFWLFLFYSSLFQSFSSLCSALLCFSSVHIVGSLTSKLPSIKCYSMCSCKLACSIINIHKFTQITNTRKTPVIAVLEQIAAPGGYRAPQRPFVSLADLLCSSVFWCCFQGW